MRFFGVLFCGVVCYSQNVANSEPVVTSLTPEIANQPKETQASIDARLALVAVCPEVTSNCSVPNGTIARNDDLADALDCMLRVNITTVPAGPCHDALAKFLNDHLNPKPDPRLVDPRMDPRQNQVDPRISQMQAAQLQAQIQAQMQAAQAQMQAAQAARMQQVDPRIAQMQAQMQMAQMRQVDPRVAQMQAMQMAQMRQMQGSQSQFPVLLVVRSQQQQQQQQPGPSTLGALLQRIIASKQSTMSPFSSQFSRSQPFRGPQPQSSRFQQSSHGFSRPSRSSRGRNDFTSRGSFPSHGFSMMSNDRRSPMPWMSRQDNSRFGYDRSRFGSSRQQSQRYWSPPQSMHSSSRDMFSSRGMSSQSSSGMNPMMMMMLPQLMKGSSSEQNPMSGLMMVTLIKKISASSSDDYDYEYESDDYDYDYAYEYDDDSDVGYGYDYDYDYVYDDSPSPMSGIIQQMLRAKMMAAQQAPVRVTVTPIDGSAPPVNVPVVATSIPENVEIAASQQSTNKGPIRPTEQVSYRNGP